jgi:hypothetical protein
MKDEGIVQPVSKEMEQLSRRLHQKCALPAVMQGARSLLPEYVARLMPQRRLRQLSDVSASCIAGLIDGEGTITLSRLHAKENRRLVVSIANTELSLLQFVLDEVGAGKITRKRVQASRHTPSFCYAVTSLQALALIKQVAPHLRTCKSLRATLALNSYRRLTPRNGKYSAALLAERRRFENELLACLPSARTEPR